MSVLIYLKRNYYLDIFNSVELNVNSLSSSVHIVDHFISDFSINEWLKDKALDIGEQLGEGAKMLLLEELNLTNFFQKPKCDRTRSPYSPSVEGMHNSRTHTRYYMLNFYIFKCQFLKTKQQ